MTVRYPPAVWRPLPEADRQPAIVPTQLIFHTVVGRGSPFGTFDRFGNGSESHLWVAMSGLVEQFISLHRSADANYQANRRPDGTGAISVETEDMGPLTVEDTPWTVAQCERLVELMVWCNDPEGLVAAIQSVTGATAAPIPLDVCHSPDGPGIGWHSMWPKPNPWTIYQGKTCPGRARKAQIPGLIIRARQARTAGAASDHPASQEDEMPDYVMTPPPGHGAAYVARYADGKAVHIGGGEDVALKSVPHFPCADAGEYDRLLEQSGTSYRDQ